MSWTFDYDGWIVLIGALAAFACALPGTFLLLRGMSMMGDAISHAVLPGIALGFLISGTRDSGWMFLGAAVAGVVTAVLSQVLHRMGRLEHGAAMGVVFTTLFAAGLILIERVAHHVHLDPGCVLYGAIEYAPLMMVDVLGVTLPRAVPILVVIGGINLIVIVLLYKEMTVSAFDADMARTSGIDSRLMHQLLMVMTAATCVACFEVVGSILVVALLVVPPAAARLLSDRLPVVLVLAVVIGSVTAGLGHLASDIVPDWFNSDIESVNAAGMMAVLAGFAFLLAWIGAPRHGLIMRYLHRLRLRVRIAAEDALGLLYRCEEEGRLIEPGHIRAALIATADSGSLVASLAMSQLRRGGLVAREGSALRLSDRGRVQGADVIRSHRLWESWLHTHARLKPDHVHDAAMRLEHVTDASVRERLEVETASPPQDPHGKPIPDRDPSE
jgi:manganese/zinc/iron transport system permease protein